MTTPRPATLATGVRLFLLGPFSLVVDDEPVRLPGAAERVLAHVALLGPTPRPVLADRLWPHAPEERGLASLRKVLWRALERRRDLLVCDGITVALGTDVVVDVDAAQAAAADVLAGNLPDDLDLVVLGLELLPGWYDEWLGIERERLRQVFVHALERASDLLLARGDVLAALDAGLLAVGCDDLRESAHRCVIRAHLSEGNLAEAYRERDAYLRVLGDAGMPRRVSPAMHALLDA